MNKIKKIAICALFVCGITVNQASPMQTTLDFLSGCVNRVASMFNTSESKPKKRKAPTTAITTIGKMVDGKFVPTEIREQRFIAPGTSEREEEEWVEGMDEELEANSADTSEDNSSSNESDYAVALALKKEYDAEVEQVDNQLTADHKLALSLQNK